MVVRDLRLFFYFVSILAFFTPSLAGAQGVNQNTPDQVRRAYDKAFETMFKDPANLEKTFSFAGLAIKAGDFEGAISSLERMLILDPNLPRVRYELGVLYFKLGSYDVAATYFEELLEDKNTPKVLVEKAAPFIEEIESRLTNHSFSGSIFSGIKYQTNASSGPRSTKVKLFGAPSFLPDEFTNKGDFDVFASGSINYSYDFQSEPKKLLEAGLNVYGNEQFDQTFVNARVIDAHIGPKLIVPLAFLNNPIVRPFIAGDYLIVSEDESYYSHGAGFSADIRATEKLNLNLDARVMARENKDASILDGFRNRMTINASYIASETMQIQFSSIVATEETKTNIQNNRDYTLNASINKTFKAPFNLIKDPLSAGLSFGGSFREYAGPNPTIDPDTTRNDYTIRFSPSLTIPAGETMAILLSAGFTRVDSNIPNSEYDNISVTLGISKQF
ncbi:MAG: tetratricopeptide repeat protein [Pseudomonadota bacterium]|jgi:tetratricopeptide (TPR) repeat protein|nr:tetratricopeptide repeat protein [Pseudomonadota bacterium]